jgi:hypothetical protein
MVRNCAPENLEIPGLPFAYPGMTAMAKRWIASLALAMTASCL